MAAEIRRSDIIEDSALKAPLELAENLKKPIAELDKLIDKFKGLNSAIKSQTSVSGVRKATEELTDAQKELLKVQAQIEKAEARNTEEYIKQQAALQKLKQAQRDKIALGDRDAKTVNALNASYKVLGAALQKNQREYAELTDAEQRNSEAGQRLLRVIQAQEKEYTDLSVALRNNKALIGDYTGGILRAYNEVQRLKGANAGLAKQLLQTNQATEEGRAKYAQLNQAIQNNITQIKQYNTVITTTGTKVQNLANQLLGSLGLVGAVYLVVNAIKSFITTNREFEKSLSTLQALTGASTEDLQFYKEAAIDIGAETKRAAKDVVESFKLIGGARPELLKNKEALAAVTREAIILANAADIELADAADALAGTLNQLQLPAEEAGRAINVLAAGAQAGAAEIPDINAALKQFGAVLKDSNGSIEEGVGLIEVLADRQIKGAEAGTALRNVLLRLAAVDVLPRSAQQQLKRFGVDLKIVGDASLPLNKRLRELGKIAGDASALVKVFGVENFVAGNIVLNNIDKFDELTTAVTGTTSAYDQNRIALDNLDGDLQGAASEVEALTLEVGKSTQSFLRLAVQGFTFTIRLLRELPAFLRENKDLFVALGLAVLAFNVPLITSNLLILKSIALDRLKTISLASVTAATRTFYATMAANPFGLIILGLAAVVAAIGIYERKSERARALEKQSTALNNELEFALQKVKFIRDGINLSIDDFIKKSSSEQQAILDNVKARKQEAVALLEMILAREESVKKTAKQVTTMTALSKVFTDIFDSEADANKRLTNTLEEQATEAVQPFQERIAKLKLEIEELDNFITEGAKTQADQTEAATKAEKDGAFALRKFRIEQAIKAMQEIEEEEKNSLARRIEANTQGVKLEGQLALLERNHALEKEKLSASERLLINEQYQAKLTEITKKNEKDRDKLNEGQAEELRRIEEAKLRAVIQTNDNILKFERSTLQQRNTALLDNIDARQQLLDIQYARDTEQAKGNAEELLRIQIDYNTESEKLARELADGIKKNFFDVYKAGYDDVAQAARDSVNSQLKALDELFVARGLSQRNYQIQRERIIETGNADALKKELEFAKESLKALKGAGIDTLEVEKQIADLEVAIAEDSANKRLRIEEKLNGKKRELAESLYNFAGTLSANLTARENQRIDAELESLQSSYDKQVLYAGDNERRKLELQIEFDRKKKKLEDEKNRNLRKQAILEKALNIAKATINTALAVTAALAEGGPVYAALVGAIGALEIAAIVTTPIPAFKDGGIAPGGLVLAGEAGTELMKSPSGQFSFTPPKATLMSVEKGTEFFSHEDTMRKLALAGINFGGTVGTKEDVSDKMLGKLDDINKSLKNVGNSSETNFIQNGSALIEARKQGETFTKKLRRLTHG